MAGLDKIKRRKNHSFIMLTHQMYDSPAWKSLRPIDQAVWLLIMRRYNGYNNGQISLSCREVADELQVSKDTASRSFKNLEKKGFIKISVFSGFTRKSGRRATRWALTHVSLTGKGPGTNDWKQWKENNGPNKRTKRSCSEDVAILCE